MNIHTKTAHRSTLLRGDPPTVLSRRRQLASHSCSVWRMLWQEPRTHCVMGGGGWSCLWCGRRVCRGLPEFLRLSDRKNGRNSLETSHQKGSGKSKRDTTLEICTWISVMNPDPTFLHYKTVHSSSGNLKSSHISCYMILLFKETRQVQKKWQKSHVLVFKGPRHGWMVGWKKSGDTLFWRNTFFQCCGSGSGIRCFFLPLDPGSGIGLFRIPDLGSRIPNPYFWELSDNSLGKKFYNSSKIGPNFFLQYFKTKIRFNFMKFVGT